MDSVVERKRGFWGTLLFHVSILAILLYFGIVTPLPSPEEQSVEVNFGDSENGLGVEEPAGNDVQAKSDAVPSDESSTSQEDVEPITDKTPSVKAVQPKSSEKVLTQNFEEAPVITETPKQKRARERDEREALEQRQKEYLQQKYKEEQEVKKRVKQKFTTEAQNRAFNAFGKGNATSGSSGSSAGTGKSGSQGITFPGGNQGVPSGKIGSNNYGKGGSGSGVSYNLSGRKATGLPKPVYPGNEEGIVVVQVTVDQDGQVKRVVPGVKGSNTMNSQLLDAARKAALGAHFNTDNNAPAFQQGTITYRFVLH
ncbi:MAG: cell envelope integrity protein TolA [Bacteroidota bacterium]|nr:cell envelope integrity protein TolA [Bacteroidota bacterium]